MAVGDGRRGARRAGRPRAAARPPSLRLVKHEGELVDAEVAEPLLLVHSVAAEVLPNGDVPVRLPFVVEVLLDLLRPLRGFLLGPAALLHNGQALLDGVLEHVVRHVGRPEDARTPEGLVLLGHLLLLALRHARAVACGWRPCRPSLGWKADWRGPLSQNSLSQ